jgi:hypothetical protein
MATANEEYDKAHDQVRQKVAELNRRLSDHSTKQTKDTKNWGYVGDMQCLNSELDEILGAFIS